MQEYTVGEKVRMRKSHPCGSYDWEILRVGADFKIRCLGCGHCVMLSRINFEKNCKKRLATDLSGSQ